jgi:hypothetical protein
MKKLLLFLFGLSFSFSLFAEDPIVSIYDEFDDGLYGKSIYRGVIVSVKKSAFARSETLPVKNDGEGYLTAVIMSKSNAEKLMNGYYRLKSEMRDGVEVYSFSKDGLSFHFSIEKASEKLINMVSDYYRNDEFWHDPLVEYYRENYVIRIHSAENVFESWTEEITYNEAMVAATLIGDSDQWLWGIHNGSEILNLGY